MRKKLYYEIASLSGHVVCSCSPAEIVDVNPNGGMDV